MLEASDSSECLCDYVDVACLRQFNGVYVRFSLEVIVQVMSTMLRGARRIASKTVRRDLLEAAGALTCNVLSAENGVTPTSKSANKTR